MVASGYFEGDKLVRHKEIEMSNFFVGLKGRYTINRKEKFRYIGEHNKNG